MNDQQESLQGGMGRRVFLAGAAAAAGSAALGAGNVVAATQESVRQAEAIHQVARLKASRERVYAALTEAALFQQVMLRSGAARGGRAMDKQPAQIARDVGGSFTLFGGYITGRHLELVPNQRIVQAWRAGSWEPGEFSIVRFDLQADGAGTRIVFDHAGYPAGQTQHLAAGWIENYWEPLEKVLA